MNLKNAQSLARCHRPGKPELQDPQVVKAVKMLEGIPEQKALHDAQVAFDDSQVKILCTIELDENLLNKIDETVENIPQGFQWKAQLKQPPFLAGMIAVLVVVGVLVYFGFDWMQKFPGKDSAERMVDTADEMTGVELEPKVTQAGMLEDWFFSKGYENYRMLPELAGMKTVGCRVFKMDGCPIAQIALENHSSLLYIFHADDFDVKISPPERWKFFQEGDWAVAIRAEDDTCFMVAFKGKKAEMEEFIAGLKK